VMLPVIDPFVDRARPRAPETEKGAPRTRRPKRRGRG
jgi:hypothetical protein